MNKKVFYIWIGLLITIILLLIIPIFVEFICIEFINGLIGSWLGYKKMIFNFPNLFTYIALVAAIPELLLTFILIINKLKNKKRK